MIETVYNILHIVSIIFYYTQECELNSNAFIKLKYTNVGNYIPTKIVNTIIHKFKLYYNKLHTPDKAIMIFGSGMETVNSKQGERFICIKLS